MAQRVHRVMIVYSEAQLSCRLCSNLGQYAGCGNLREIRRRKRVSLQQQRSCPTCAELFSANVARKMLLMLRNEVSVYSFDVLKGCLLRISGVKRL